MPIPREHSSLHATPIHCASTGFRASEANPGIPDAVVMALVGHESTAMNHRYTHVGKEALAKAEKTLPEI
jgi:hypothetical protein